ncbi:MAG: hypothetical protein NWF07_09810 [Candidatus Bathyarchaeota archaeon]|nr:hypothetical protein [Candidatus Bathyarchaeota archaeon]
MAATSLYERGLKSKSPQVGIKNRELEAKIKQFREGLSRHRVPPVSVLITGPPGCGKTVFMERMSSCWKARMRIDNDVQVMYEFSPTSFQSPPSILSILTVNDFFQLKAECPKMKVDPLDLLQKLSDSAPLDMEGASVEMKNHYIQPDFVLITSNAKTYQFSNSVGGVSKLDRRYFVLEMKWSEAMLNFCALGKYTAHWAYRNGVYKAKVKHPVIYRIGHMVSDESPNNQSINIQVDNLLFETTEQDKVIGFLFTQEALRADSFANRLPPVLGQLCACGLALGSGCPCEAIGGVRLVPPVQEEQARPPIPLGHVEMAQEEEEPVPAPQPREPYVPQRLHFELDPEMGAPHPHLQGVTHSVSRDSQAFISETMDRMEAVAQCLPGAPGGGFEASLNRTIDKAGLIAPGRFKLDHVFSIDVLALKPAHLIGVAVTLGVFTVAFKHFSSRFESQGLVHSTTSFPKENLDPRPLPPFHATQAPFLKPNPSSHVVSISRRSGTTRVNMHAVVLTKYWLAVPYHFFKKNAVMGAIEEGDTIYIEYLGLPFEYKFQRDYLCVIDEKSDRAYLYNPCMHSVSAGVYNLLPELPTVPDEPVDLGEFKSLKCRDARDGFITYDAPTLDGSCGQPLVGTRTGAVYGFHFARFFAFYSHSQAQPLCKSEVRKVFKWGMDKKMFSEVHSDSLPKVLQQKVAEGVIHPGMHPRSDASWYAKEKGDSWPLHNHVSVGHFGSCDKEKFSVHQTTLHARFGGRCKEYGNPHPGKAVLQPDGTYGSAVATRLNVSKNPNFTWNFQVAMRVLESMIDELDVQPTRPLSDFEALCGSPVDVMMNAKDTSKSIGPTARLMGLKKEEAFRETSKGEYEVDALLLEAIKELEQELEYEEVLSPCYVKAQGKDEAYPKEKADKGRKRFFYLSDWPLNHVGRKMLLPLISLLIRQPFNSSFLIAINAASPAWKTVTDWLEELGVDIMDADFGSFDLCHRFLLLMYVAFMCLLAEKAGYTSPEVVKSRRLMMKRLWYCLEMEGNFFLVLYQLCSGWMDTIIVNSFCVKFMYYYVYFVSCMELKVVPREPRSVIHLAAVGDDSAANIHRAIQHILNPAIMQLATALMGYTMTAGDKSAVMRFTEISKIVFLKRAFVREGGRVWGSLALDSIYKALSYSTGKMTPEQQRARDESAANSAIREMFLHGESMYNELLGELILEFPHARYPSYEELLLEYDMGMFETWREIKPSGTVMVLQGSYSEIVSDCLVPAAEEWLRTTGVGLFSDVAVASATASVTTPAVGYSYVFSTVLTGLCPWWVSLASRVLCNIYARNTTVWWLKPCQVPLVFIKHVGVACEKTVEAMHLPHVHFQWWISVLNFLVIAPMGEEEIKRGAYGWFFPYLEFMIYVAFTPWQYRLSALLFHYFTLSFPYFLAVMVHSLWNLMALHHSGMLDESILRGVGKTLTDPICEFNNYLIRVIYYFFPLREGRDVVHQMSQGAVTTCPIPVRGAFTDFPVPQPLQQTGVYSLQAQIDSTELNSTSGDVSDITTHLTHITAINADTDVVIGGSPPYNPSDEQSFKTFFSRPRIVRTMTTPITGLQAFSVMQDWLALGPVASMNDQWGLFRGSPKITVSYTGSSSYQGLVRVYFFPSTAVGNSTYSTYTYPNITVHDMNYTSTSNLPHLDLDMSESCTCSIDLPYIANVPITEWANDWNYGFLTINPIVSASGVTPGTVKITVFVSYPDAKVARAQYQSAVEVQGGMLSRGLALAASLSKWFPITTPYTKMLELGSRAAYSLGYSRAVEPVSSSMVSKRLGSLGYLTGEASFANTLGSDPQQTSDMGFSMVPGKEVDSIMEICRMYSMIGAGWSLSNELQVLPTAYGFSQGTSISLTNLGNMGIMFERWSGNLKYKIQVVTSPLIRWRLGVVYTPPGVVAPTVFPVEGSYVTHIIEVAGTTEYEFQCEYLSHKAYLDTAIISALGPAATYGSLKFFSLADPAGPSATVVFPYINIWVCAGDDFSLSVPSMELLKGWKRLQAKYVEDFLDAKLLQAAYSQIEVASLGEKVDSLRMLAKRKCYSGDWAPAGPEANVFQFPADGFLGSGTVTLNPGSATPSTMFGDNFTFDNYIRQLFLGYRGGTAYTVYSPNNTTDWLVGTSKLYFPQAPSADLRVKAVGRGAALYYPDFNKAFEMVVPDRSGTTFKRSLINMVASSIESIIGVKLDTNATTTPTYWAIHTGAGDDRTFVLYLGANRLFLRA